MYALFKLCMNGCCNLHKISGLDEGLQVETLANIVQKWIIWQKYTSETNHGVARFQHNKFMKKVFLDIGTA